MNMKRKDVSVATALIIQGFLRANGDDGLGEALAGIRQEISDWSENLLPTGLDGSAIEPGSLAVGAAVGGCDRINRTPYNLVSVALAALSEAIDLCGPDAIWSDFDARKVDFLQPPEA